MRIAQSGMVILDDDVRLDRLTTIGRELKASSPADTIAFAYGVGDHVVAWHDESEGRFFDLASLTKPLFAAPAVLLHMGNTYELDTPVGYMLSNVPRRIAALTPRQLLTHTAGLPAELPAELLMGLDTKDAEHLVWHWLADEAVLATPGQVTLYSDPSYWLVGQLVRELADLSLQETFAQLPTSQEGEFTFGPPTAERAVAAGPIRNGMQLPHDPATQRLGLSGHAGSFGTLRGVIHAVTMWLNNDWIPEKWARSGSTCHTHRTPGGHRSLAWTLIGDPYHCVAHDWPTSTLCHTGFTGVCIALDPESRWWGIYLSNALPIGRDAGPVLKARRLFYAQVAEDLQDRPTLPIRTH